MSMGGWGGPGVKSSGENTLDCMRGSRQFCQRGSNFDRFFLFCFSGELDPNKYHHKMVFCWCADDGPALNAGFVAL